MVFYTIWSLCDMFIAYGNEVVFTIVPLMTWFVILWMIGASFWCEIQTYGQFPYSISFFFSRRWFFANLHGLLFAVPYCIALCSFLHFLQALISTFSKTSRWNQLGATRSDDPSYESEIPMMKRRLKMLTAHNQAIPFRAQLILSHTQWWIINSWIMYKLKMKLGDDHDTCR